MEKSPINSCSEKRRVRRTFAIILGALLLVSACAVIPVAALDPTSWNVTVQFDGNGDVDESTVPASVVVKDGDYITLPPAPKWDGHIFKGWGKYDSGMKIVGQPGDRYQVRGGHLYPQSYKPFGLKNVQ